MGDNCKIHNNVFLYEGVTLEDSCGISCEAENPKAIADAIKQLKALPAEKRRQMGQRGRKYVLKNHNYKVLVARFIEAMQ